MTLKRPVLLLLFILVSFLAFSQPGPGPDHVSWYKFETSIKEKKELEASYKELEAVKKRMLNFNNYINYAHAWYYQLQITDARTEDSLYFRNSAFIDSILFDAGAPASLQMIMHMLQAKRLDKFLRKIAWHGRRHYAATTKNNYSAFSDAMIDSAAQYHFEAAKKLVPVIDEHADSFSWLGDNDQVLLFLPTLFDIVIAEQIEYNTYYISRYSNKNVRLLQWLFLKTPDFINVLDTIESSKRAEFVLRLYSDWLKTHKDKEDTYYYLETVARRFVFEQVRNYVPVEIDYEKYLLKGSESPYPTVRAHTVYQLIKLWYARSTREHTGIDKIPPRKVKDLYDRHLSLFYHYAPLLNDLDVIKDKLLKVYLNFQIAGVVMPDEPLLAKIEYKNATTFFYRIIRVGANEKIPSYEDSAVMYLLSKPGIRSVNENLPALFDLLDHKVLMKIDPLPAGSYYILFAPHYFNEYDKSVSRAFIQVSSMAIVPGDKRVYVLNRKNGAPIAGAKTEVTYDEDDATATNIANKSGYVPVRNKGDYDILVTHNGDTLEESGGVEDNELYGDLFDKEDGDLFEYYLENARIHMYTDRGIYRPGQTVHYKGILMTKDPKTGADIIVNKKNLQHGIFKNILKEWLREEEPELYVTDPFNRKVDTIAVKPDAWGSISGTYHLPARAATGDWYFGGDIETGGGTGYFSVEEYKRPTFEIKVESPEKIHLPGDTVVFKLNVRAFSGAPMDNTTISYMVRRNCPYTFEEGKLAEMELAGVVQTKVDGKAEIIVIDTALQKLQLPDSVKVNFQYQLVATATDITGESHKTSQYTVASTWPVDIKVDIKTHFFASEFKPIAVSAKNKQVSVEKDIVVKVFRHKKENIPVGPFTNYADLWMYPKEQFSAWFPHILFAKEDNATDLVFEKTIKRGTSEKLELPAAVLTMGEYTIKAACFDDNNIVRGETENRFTVYDTTTASVPAGDGSFFHVRKETVNAGGTVQVFMGSAYDSTWLLTQVKYYSQKSKKLVVVPVYGEQLIKRGVHAFVFQLPADARDQALISSFFVRNNEVYRHDKTVWVIEQSIEPAIVIEQYRSKLTPGQQTTFSVSVKTKDHRVAAQVMSTMYDASLDQLENHSWDMPRLVSLERLQNNWPQQIYGIEARQSLCPNFKAMGWGEGNNRSGYFNFQSNLNYSHGFGSVPGLASGRNVKLNEVIVVGYGASRRNNAKGDVRSYLDDEEGKKEAIIKVRSNFNELAFFQPAAYADRDGYYRFTFTVPESLTEWNWKLLAHTKNTQFAYAERTLVTQLPLMVQPNMPRQLYQGDQLTLKTRISNLDSLRRAGKVTCKVEDAVTGEDISVVILKNGESNFDVAAKSNTVASFKINIPEGQLNPVKVIIKAVAGEFGDGEEHIIPVMTGKVLVKQAIPFRITTRADTTVSLPAVNELYGIALNVQAKPQGALINSLPFLANYSFDCAEQTFNKMLANVTALEIMRTDKTLQQLYNEINKKAGNATPPAILPEQICEQAMPWLHLNSRSALQQTQLATLLDTALAQTNIEKHWQKLASLQHRNGGLSWFEGGYSDPYITAYVLAGLGKLGHNFVNAGFLKAYNIPVHISKLVHYIDSNYAYNNIYCAYARGYWKTDYPVTESQLARMQQFIKQQWQKEDKLSLHQQAVLIIATMQWFNDKNSLYEKALNELENIRQLSIIDPVNGIRWKALADEADMSTSAEETLALLAEAFSKTGHGTVIREGIAKWLLTSKTDHQWHSTKAAAAAIGILQQTQAVITGAPNKLSTVINGRNVSVTNSLLSGEPFTFVQAGKIPEAILLKKEGAEPVLGSLAVYHFTPAAQFSRYNTDIKLLKKLFTYNKESKSWEPVSEGAVLKIAEKVKVTLTIETSVNLPYVYIDDKSGGAFDAADLRSGYHYGDRISYYRSVRDAGMQFFASLVPEGKTEISYELTVAQEGIFTNGPASLQCMYKPEKAAYSNSTLINTEE